MSIAGNITLHFSKQNGIILFFPSVQSLAATQNIDKYIYIEILKVLANISYCFSVYAFALNKCRYYSQVLVHSTVVNSRLAIGTYLQMLAYATL